MAFNPQGLATAIGSFPHTDPDAACGLILRTIPEVPVWPQLPKIDFRELMDFQYSEGLPRIVVDEQKRSICFDTAGDFSDAFARFYEEVMAENLEHFRISPACSRGIYAVEEKLSAVDLASVRFIKSQVTGPVTFGLGINDETGKAIYYNEVFRDVVVKGMIMKARWLLRTFSRFEREQICFVDEPVLSAFGSSTYVGVQRADVVRCLGEVIEAVKKDGALTGTHCCGNTEWTILADASVDIINFDAYEFGETIAYYPVQIKTFLEKGGVLAWGIVPTSEKISRETPESLVKKLHSAVDNLAGKGIEKSLIWDRCLLTPSCGTGSLSVALSEKVMEYLAEASRIVRSA